jgi:hypothetical protein
MLDELVHEDDVVAFPVGSVWHETPEGYAPGEADGNYLANDFLVIMEIDHEAKEIVVARIKAEKNG